METGLISEITAPLFDPTCERLVGKFRGPTHRALQRKGRQESYGTWRNISFIKDEDRPFGIGCQEQAPNHLKQLLLGDHKNLWGHLAFNRI